MTETVLQAENISMRFPGVLAVDNVSLGVGGGEILALAGENGAGKSTLMQVLGGALRPDAGRILLNGRPVSFASPRDALRLGVSMVFQELSLTASLSVAENLLANRQPVGRFGFIRRGELYAQTRALLQRFELDLDPWMPVKRLSMGRRQILEILKAISTGPQVLILDEPTSSLAEAEIALLFRNIRRLRDEGMAFIYITHKLSEIFQIADRVAVMRDGRFIGDWPTAAIDETGLVTAMVGRRIANLYGERSAPADAAPFFEVRNLVRRGAFGPLDFGLRRGEIVGLAGLVGAGRTELGRALTGIDPADSGSIRLDAAEIRIRRPADAFDRGIVYVTEDRKGQGLFLAMSVRDNLAAPDLQRFAARFDFLSPALMDAFARKQMEAFAVAAPSPAAKTLNLSGGNQQKVMLAMWMSLEPRVLIADEPTRGVDVGARAEIYQKLREFASTGGAVLMISSDLPELIGMCDRILVMHRGRIAGEAPRSDFTEERILAYAAGLSPAGLKPGGSNSSHLEAAG